MNTLPKLTESAVRERAAYASFQRGYAYYRDGAVLQIARRGNQLLAKVQGSAREPYQVSVSLSEHDIEDANCTCPYYWDGDCKHTVAALLTYIHSPDEIEELPTMEIMLDGLDREQLQTLILRLVEHQPDLADMIQELL